ncbi:hypothetical protein PCE1_003497 [Barthelona sp. PCE]
MEKFIVISHDIDSQELISALEDISTGSMLVDGVRSAFELVDGDVNNAVSPEVSGIVLFFSFSSIATVTDTLNEIKGKSTTPIPSVAIGWRKDDEEQMPYGEFQQLQTRNAIRVFTNADFCAGIQFLIRDVRTNREPMGGCCQLL